MPLAIAVGGASGGGDAQPPVAFSYTFTETKLLMTLIQIIFDIVILDTDNG